MALEDMLNKSMLSKGAGKKNPIPKTIKGKIIRKRFTICPFENGSLIHKVKHPIYDNDDVEFDED